MAHHEGVDETLIDAAMDSDNVEGGLIEGILMHRSATAAGDRTNELQQPPPPPQQQQQQQPPPPRQPPPTQPAPPQPPPPLLDGSAALPAWRWEDTPENSDAIVDLYRMIDKNESGN